MQEACRWRLTEWWTGPPPWWRHSDESGSSWLISNKELNLKNGVSWSWRLGIVEWLVPKVVTGQKVGGWLEAGGRGVLGSVPSKYC